LFVAVEASENQPDEYPELEFALAAGWPEEVEHQVRRLFSFDTDEVQGQRRLGALSFDAAPEQLEEIRSIVKDLALEPWDELQQPGGVLEQIRAVNDLVDEMLALSSEMGNAPQEKERLENQLGELLQWFRTEGRQRARRAFMYRVLAERPDRPPEGAELDEMRESFASLRSEAAEVKRQLEGQRDLANEFRDAARESAGQELSGVFLDRAGDCKDAAMIWLVALAMASIGAIVGAIVTFNKVRPDEGSHDPHDLAGLGLGLFILGILAFAVRICAQNYRVNRHLEAVARSKAAAISTFQRLVSSVEEEEVKSAVTLTLAQAIFTTEETGLVDGSGDHVTLVERAVMPAVARSTTSGGS
jgi:hypothetical protein